MKHQPKHAPRRTSPCRETASSTPARPRVLALCALAAACSAKPNAPPQRHESGAFAVSRDVGEVGHAGTLLHREDASYLLHGAGADVWSTRDAFHFASRPVEGDVQLQAEVELLGDSTNQYRKAVLMMRENLEADAAYVDVALHQNGLASLQYRPYAGAPTLQLKAGLRHPTRLRLERQGDEFTALVSRDGKLSAIGPVAVDLPDTLEVGIGVSSHDRDELAAASFRDLTLSAP